MATAPIGRVPPWRSYTTWYCLLLMAAAEAEIDAPLRAARRARRACNWAQTTCQIEDHSSEARYADGSERLSTFLPGIAEEDAPENVCDLSDWPTAQRQVGNVARPLAGKL